MTRTITTIPRGAVGSLGETNIVAMVPGLTTTTVDLVSRSTTRCVKWILTITDTITDFTVVQEIMSIDGATGLKFSRYNIIGDNIQHNIQVALLSGNFNLTIINPTTNTYSVKVLRFEIS